MALAELAGAGDGPYCAKHGAGGALVVLGTYIVDAADDVDYPADFVFKPGRAHYANYLKTHVAAARQGGAKVGVSVVSVEMEDTVDFLGAIQDAGADYASYCAHSTMEMFVRRDLSSRLCHRDRWDALRRWATAVVGAVDIPVIFKIGTEAGDDVRGAVDIMVDCGAPVVHINAGSTDAGSAGLDVVSALKGRCPLLIAGGGIADLQGARRALAAGADAVAVGTAAMKDPTLIGTIQQALRA